MLHPTRLDPAETVLPEPSMKPGLIRVLGRWTLTALVLNCIIASGIFGLPDDVARLVGPAAPWAYLIGAIGTGIIIAVFAELASQFRDAGGPYVYAREAFGPLAGIQTAWFVWLARIASGAAIANVFVAYLGEFWSGITAPVPRALLLCSVIAVLVIINIRGTRQGAGLSNVITVAKLVPLGLFIVVGIFLAPHLAPLPLSVPASPGHWIDALVVLLFAYGGFEQAFLPAGEATNPRRDAPFALLTGVVVVAGIYFLVHCVAMWSVPDLAHSERPLADAARVFAGSIGAQAISLGAVLSTLGGLCAAVITAPRLVYALGERGDFPRIFAAVHSRFRTPYVSILVWAACVLVLALWGSFIWNAVLSVAARLVTYAMSCGALIQMRRSQPNADVWRAPAGRLLAVLGFGFCVLLVVRMNSVHALIVAGVSAVAMANWLAVRSRLRTMAIAGSA
jgi:basic amino acid/polyamine antiporter, APA family